LYYRIAVVLVEMPPLRQRPEDVGTLVEQFLVDAARELKVPRRSIDPAALKKLEGYEFPGNIRELRNLIERACILARGQTISAKDFPLGNGVATSGEAPGGGNGDPVRRCAQALPPTIDLRDAMEQLEKALLTRAMEDAGGVQAEAARRLNLSRSDIGYKLRKYGLQPADGSEEDRSKS
jgi:transcriptional regulator with GAF, ATPase, and Fis domain